MLIIEYCSEPLSSYCNSLRDNDLERMARERGIVVGVQRASGALQHHQVGVLVGGLRELRAHPRQVHAGAAAAAAHSPQRPGLQRGAAMSMGMGSLVSINLRYVNMD
jgi:hypothetical protein